MRKGKIGKMILKFLILSIVVTISSCGSPVETSPQTLTQTNAPRQNTNTNPNSNIISARGVVESVESRDIFSNLGLTVQHVYVEVGDIVTAGQTLATLEAYDIKLSIAQHKATIELARQNNETMLSDTQRMLDEAAGNLSRGTNMHVVSATSALTMAAANLEAVQVNYGLTRRDIEEGNDPHLMAAENAVRDVLIALETLEANHQNLYALYNQGLLAREDIRQSNNAITATRNQYEDAQAAVRTATDAQERAIEQLQIQLNSARAAYRDARNVVSASHIAARQEVDTIRNHMEIAEIATNLEHMEIALQMLERQLEQTFITAPISGTVTAVHAREGAPGMGLMFTIEDIENLKVTTGFREYDIGLLATDMEVAIIPNATGVSNHTGVISRINPAAIVGLPIVEFEVEVLVTSPNSGLRVGMNARVEVDIERTGQ